MPSVMLLEGPRSKVGGKLPSYLSSLNGNPIGDWILQQNTIVGGIATLVLSGVAGALVGIGAIWLKDRR